MYCNNCGEFLSGKEKFCSNCGIKLDAEKDKLKEENNEEKVVEELGFISKEEKSFIDEEVKKVTLPVMNWNVDEFSSRRKEENKIMDISWRNDDMFLGKELRKEDERKELVVDFNKREDTQQEEQESEKEKVASIEIPSIFSAFRKKDEESVSTQDIKDEDIQGEKQRTIVVEEVGQPSLGLAIEIEKNVEGKGHIERILNEEPQMTSVLIEQQEVNKEDNIEDRKVQEENLEDAVLEIKDIDEGLSKEALQAEKAIQDSLFDEISPSVVKTLENSMINEEKKRIDKFYTFNKKKEEFQKLLDKEYERIEKNVDRGGFEEEVSSFIDVEVGTDVDATNQLEEMARARTLFFDSELSNIEIKTEEDILREQIENYEIDPKLDRDTVNISDIEEAIKVLSDDVVDIATEDTEKNIEEGNEEDLLIDISDINAELEEKAKEYGIDKIPNIVIDVEKDTDETANIAAIIADDRIDEKEFETKRIDELSKALKEVENKEAETVQVVMEPDKAILTKDKEDIADEFFKSDDDIKKSKGIKVFISILVIATILVGVLLAVRVFMPTSVVSTYIDNTAGKIMSIFSKEDESKPSEVKEPSLDRTRLIDENKDKNFENNIASIISDSSLKHNQEDDKRVPALQNSKVVADMLWYKDDEGNSIKFDSAAVGRTIEFVSKRNAYIENKNEEFKNLIQDTSGLISNIESRVEAGEIQIVTDLSIGDIRSVDNKIYVWVKEKTNKGDSLKIYEFVTVDKELKLSKEYKIN